MGTDASKIKPATGAQTVRANAQTAQKSALGSDGQCGFCQRAGFPILPLRYAVKPSYVTPVPQSLASVPMLEQFANRKLNGNRYTLRTMRKGYVHVYLGVAGHWQTYVATEDGYLRLLKDPDDPDHKTDRPLTAACQRDGHNIPASFINIPEKYKKVWLAFSDTAWNKKVRQSYEKTPDKRMQAFNCTNLAADPGKEKHALEITADGAHLHGMVEEYAASDSEYKLRRTFTAEVVSKDKPKTEKHVWDSIHGNHARSGQIVALGAYVKSYQAKAAKTAGKARKVAAVALFDPVGVVQEINATRLHFIQSRQNYNQVVMRPLIVSQSLLGLKKYFEQSALAMRTAEEKKKNLPDVQTEVTNYSDPMIGVYGGGTTTTTTRAERAKEDADKAWKKIAERYSETDRKAFDDRYMQAMKRFQQEIEQQGQDWAIWAEPMDWINRFNDYSTDVAQDYLGLVDMAALCLAGGAGEDQFTQAVWKKWLSGKPGDAAVPVYGALFGNRKDVLGYLLPEGGELNKGDKLYDTAKGIVASDQVGGPEALKKFIDGPLKDNVSTLIQAITGSASRLEDKLSVAASLAAHRATQAALALYNDVDAIFIKVQMTVREYQRMLSEISFQVKGTVRREVGSLVLGGMLSINNPRVRDTLIEVTIWTLDKATNVKAALEKAAKASATGVRTALRSVAISSVIISDVVRQELRSLSGKIELSAQQVKAFAKDLMIRNIRISAVGEPALAAGSLFFQVWAFKDSWKSVKEKLGAEGNEAQLSLLSAGIGIMAASTELVGATLKMAGKTATGKFLIKIAGFVGAASAFVDAIQAYFSSRRALSHGDVEAYRYYLAATTAFVLGGIATMFAAASSASLLGPLGLAIFLIGAGVVALWIAMNAESTAAELWADRCYFGLNKNKKGKWSDEQYAEELAELNSIVAGLRVELGTRNWVTQVIGATWDSDGHYDDNLKLKISFGMFDTENSVYEWAWYAKHRVKGNIRLDGGRYGPSAPLALPRVATKVLKKEDIQEWPAIDRYQPTLAYDEKGNVVARIEQRYANIDSSEFEETSLVINYWPDSSDPTCLAGTLVSEEI